MPKTKKIKKVRKKKKITIPSEDTYTVSAYFNNTEHTAQVKDVAEYLMSIKPFLLKTKVILKIEKNGKKTEKMLIPKIARRLWMLPVALRAVITRLNYK